MSPAPGADALDWLDALLAVGRSTAGGGDSRTVALAVLGAAERLLPGSRSLLWETEPDGEAPRLVEARRPGAPPEPGSVLLAARGLADSAAGHPAPEATPAERADVTAPEGSLSFPLLHGGLAYGTLTIIPASGMIPTPHQRRLLEALAAQAAASIAGAVLYRGEETRARRLTTLNTLTRLINAAPDSRQVFDAVAEAAASLLSARITHVWVDDPVARALRMEGCWGRQPGKVGAVELPYGKGVVGLVFESQQPEFIPDVREDPRWANQRSAAAYGLHSAAEIPLITGDGIVGVLSFLFGDRREFSAEDRELMGLLAGHAAVAIKNRRAEESLRHAHAETERLLASIAWILIAVDRDDRVHRWNEAAERTFGISAAAVLGRPFAESGIPWAWERVLGRVAECRGRGLAVRLEDVAYRRPEGRDGVLSLILNPVGHGGHDGHGRAGLLLLGADVTDRRLLEMQLAQAQKLESIGQLAAGVAHEINTPIQFVGDNTRFLQDAFRDLLQLLDGYRVLRQAAARGAVGADDLARVVAAEQAAEVDYLAEEIPRAVAQTLDGVERVATIVRALKAFAHPDAGERVLADLNHAIQSTLTVARNEIKYVADVETALSPLPPVLCHPGALNQALLNVIINAAHAVGEITAATGQRGRIRVRSLQEAGQVVISVSDTGPGIPAAIRSRIFEPFFTTKGPERGTGQGLTLARAVVERHGGTITFESEEGRGTTFFIRLPVDAPSPEPER